RTAADIASELSASFLSNKVDAVFLLYNEFISAVSQRVTLTQLLPFQSFGPPAAGADKKAIAQVDFKYEPGQQEVLDKLVPQALAIKVYRALLESVAAEHG